MVLHRRLQDIREAGSQEAGSQDHPHRCERQQKQQQQQQ